MYAELARHQPLFLEDQAAIQLASLKAIKERLKEATHQKPGRLDPFGWEKRRRHKEGCEALKMINKGEEGLQATLDQIYLDGNAERETHNTHWYDAATLLIKAGLTRVPIKLEPVNLTDYQSTGCPHPIVPLGGGDLAHSFFEVRGRTIVLENDNIYTDFPIRKVALRILRLIRDDDLTSHMTVETVVIPRPNSSRVEYCVVTFWRGWRFELLVNSGEDDGTRLTTHYDEAMLLADLGKVELPQAG